MCVYLRTKFQVFNLILTSFRRVVHKGEKQQKITITKYKSYQIENGKMLMETTTSRLTS